MNIHAFSDEHEEEIRSLIKAAAAGGVDLLVFIKDPESNNVPACISYEQRKYADKPVVYRLTEISLCNHKLVDAMLSLRDYLTSVLSSIGTRG